MKKNKQLFFILILSIIVYSCSKDDDASSTPTPTNSDIQNKLTAHYWRLAWEHEAYTSSGFTVNFTYNIGTCNGDNRYTFNSSGKLIMDPYTNNVCAESADTSDWTLKSNETILRTRMWLSPFYTNDYTILELTSSSLKIATYFEDTISSPPSWYYRDTIQYVYP